MSFLPDLASWALGGGAGNNAEGEGEGEDKGGDEQQQQQQQQQRGNSSQSPTEDEVRAKRLARMMAMQQQQSGGGGEQADNGMEVESSVPAEQASEGGGGGGGGGGGDGGDGDNDVDMIDANDSNKPAASNSTTCTSTSSRSTPPEADHSSGEMDVDEPRAKKKKGSPPKAATRSSTSSPSASDMARKLHKKKELLLRRTLAVTLPPCPSDPACVAIDAGILGPADDASSAGGPAITVQSIAEILAARLSLPSGSPSLQTAPTQKPGTIAYLGQCYVRSADEVKAIRQGRERRDKKKKKSAVSATATSAATDAILNSHDDELTALLVEIQAQVVSYAASSLMEPDLFEIGADGPAQLASALKTAGFDPSQSITMNVAGGNSSFYAKLCDELRGIDAAEFARVIGEVVVHLSDAMAKCETVTEGGGTGPDGGTDGPLVLVNALTSLCGHKAAAAVVASHPTFLLPPEGTAAATERVTPSQPTVPTGANPQQAQLYRMMAALTRGARRGYARRSGPALEKDTVLGRAMKLGCPFDDPNILASFANMGSRPKKDSDHVLGGLRSQLTVYQVALNGLVKSLITAGAESRGKVMDWFKDAFLVNVGAAAMRPDRSKVSNPTTLINIAVALLKLCEPFLTNDKKAVLIDPDFVSSPSDHGGVYTTEGDDAPTRLAENPPPPLKAYAPKNSFIPQCFFLAARSIHLSVIPALELHENLARGSSRAYHDAQARGDDGRTDPNFNRHLAHLLAQEVTIFSPDLLGDSLRFANAMGGLLLRIKDDELARMPEHFIDDLCDCVTMVCRFRPEAMRGVDVSNVFRVVVKLLSPSYALVVRNYNLRAKLGDVLHDLYLPPKTSHRDAVPSSVYCDPLSGGQPFLLSDKLAQETLAPSLLLLYGEVEHTGYYEKMSHRARISELLRFLWESSEHRPAFRKISQNKESFIKFANGLMNETNHQIAEAMEKLVEIRRVQVQMANPQEWSAIPEEQRETISSRHEANEGEVKSTLQGLNKTLEMLGWLNTDADIRKLFLLDEMVSRLVNMLFHVLMKLVGSKGLELKVDNPESYNFRPKEMLRDLCAIFANFSSAQEFCVECARSGYYDAELVTKATRTCRRYNLLTDENMKAFESLSVKVDAASKDVEDFDELTKDAPDEFLDPLMCTFMKDPVFLPTSEKYIDRATITQHLLNDPKDPFNRKDLTIDMIQPATELKEKMNRWLEQKRGAEKNADT